MTPADALTLEASIVALSRMDLPLSPDLQDAIHRLGQRIAQHDATAVNELRDAICQHEVANQLYSKAREELQQFYELQQQSTSYRSVEISASFDSIDQSLPDIAARILQADDFKTAARQLIQTIGHQFQAVTPALQIFLECLEHAIEGLDQHATIALEELARQPLSLEDLSFALDQPLEDTQRLVHRLWSRGYIVPAEANFFQKSFPSLRPQPEARRLQPSTLFTLTAKGYFHLHPVMKSRA
jgi:hypothetical protein